MPIKLFCELGKHYYFHYAVYNCGVSRKSCEDCHYKKYKEENTIRRRKARGSKKRVFKKGVKK